MNTLRLSGKVSTRAGKHIGMQTFTRPDASKQNNNGKMNKTDGNEVLSALGHEARRISLDPI